MVRSTSSDGVSDAGRALAAERGEHVEVTLAEPVACVDLDELRRQGLRDPVDASDDEQWGDVEVRAL